LDISKRRRTVSTSAARVGEPDDKCEGEQAVAHATDIRFFILINAFFIYLNKSRLDGGDFMILDQILDFGRISLRAGWMERMHFALSRPR
jgi:hypothetical protein